MRVLQSLAVGLDAWRGLAPGGGYRLMFQANKHATPVAKPLGGVDHFPTKAAFAAACAKVGLRVYDTPGVAKAYVRAA